MTTTIRSTPTPVDLEMYAGDDWSRQFFFTLDAPKGGIYVGAWSATVNYPSDDRGTNLVTVALVPYKLVAPSINVTPGTDLTKWKPLTLLDLTGYTTWAATMRGPDSDSAAFTVDATNQASSVIVLSIAGTVVTTRSALGPQRWDIQAKDPNNKIRTFYAGRVLIDPDATRP